MPLKIITNKKAQDYVYGPHKTVFYIVFAVFVTVMVLSLVMIFTNENENIAKLPKNLEIDLVKFRITNSNCFLKPEQKINRLLYIIDWNKFNQDTADSCIIADKKDSPQYRITLTLISKYEDILDLKSLKQPFEQKKIQTKHYIGSAKSIASNEDVFKDNELYRGRLEIETK